MMRVGLVGLTNVGKSTIFNKLVGYKRALVSDVAGTTRDFLIGEMKSPKESSIELVDFAGFDFDSSGIIDKKIQDNLSSWLDMCEGFLFIVDGRRAATQEDKIISKLLIKKKKKVILIANKVDGPIDDRFIHSFYSLGLGEPIRVSAKQNKGMSELREEIYKSFRSLAPVNRGSLESVPRIVLLGRPNAGKSSIFNYICGEDRSIVSDIPGTTRDRIDSLVDLGGNQFLFIDTAGLNRKSKISDNLESDAVGQSLSAIRGADIVIVVVDSGVGPVSQDIVLLQQAVKKGKRVVVVISKWDLKEKDYSKKKYQEMLEVDNSIFKKVPILFTSVNKKNGAKDLVSWILSNHKAEYNIPTAKLNRFIGKINSVIPGVRGKIYYATQTSNNPVEIIMFVNNRDYFNARIIASIENAVTKEFGLLGVEVKINIKGKRD